MTSLGLGLGAARRLRRTAQQGNAAARRIFQQLGKISETSGKTHADTAQETQTLPYAQKPLPPLHFRPPHLRPRQLATLLEIEIDAARRLVRAWATHDPTAEADHVPRCLGEYIHTKWGFTEIYIYINTLTRRRSAPRASSCCGATRTCAISRLNHSIWNSLGFFMRASLRLVSRLSLSLSRGRIESILEEPT